MLINENTVVEGKNCVLVPYDREFVEDYHSWFKKDPELLELTSSEPLSVEEEYANQISWRQDPNKLTFLIRDTTIGSKPLCGDINCFFSEFFHQDWNDSQEMTDNPIPEGRVAEINLMIAEKGSRRKGIAAEALNLFCCYTVEKVENVRVFVAKIQSDNIASINLFSKAGFVEYKRLECFNEIHYCKLV